MKHKKNAEMVIRLLKIASELQDQERAHIAADDALCSLLLILGYEDVVAEYQKIDKWFA